jgi:hypothetical protein
VSRGGGCSLPPNDDADVRGRANKASFYYNRCRISYSEPSCYLVAWVSTYYPVYLVRGENSSSFTIP